MAEEVRISSVNTINNNRVTDWETGLPELTDLPPLSHLLISPEVASAFSISPEPHRNMIDVDLASQNTLSSLQQLSQHQLLNKTNNFKSVTDDREEEIVLEGEETVDLVREGSPVRKRIRLVWTPELHKRFIEVVAHIGVKNAVPKTVMQLMNVEGLTRENVSSHLQKYRLYLKRMQGLSNEEASCSDHDSGAAVSIPMPYAPLHMLPMPYLPPPQIVPSGSGSVSGGYHQGFEYHSHPYIGSVSPYQHSMTHNHK